MSEASPAPLARLVLFMVCLAIAGSVLAGAHYYAVDLPQQNTIQAPGNAYSSTATCAICKSNCKGSSDYFQCLSECDLVCY